MLRVWSLPPEPETEETRNASEPTIGGGGGGGGDDGRDLFSG